MEIYNLNRSDIQDFFEPHATVSELFVWLETDFIKQNKLVCQFIINGRKLTEMDELDWAAKPLADIQNIQVKVEGEKDLVLNVVEAWVEALPEMLQFIEDVVKSTLDGSKTFKIQDILNVVDQQETFVSSLMSLKSPLKKMGLDMQKWSELETLLLKYAKECVQHLEAKNFVELIQTMEYDGAHALEEWRLLLSTMKAKMVEDAPTQHDLSLPSPSKRSGQKTGS